MRTTLIVTPLIVVALTLGGCSTVTQRDAGAIIGGALGGVLGSQVGGGRGRTAAIIAGTIAGAYIGGEIGSSMDEGDAHRSQHTLETNRTGETTSWNNPNTGNQYSVTPTRTWNNNSRPCREYTTDAVIDGRQETVYGTACREDGVWVASN